MRKRDIIQKYLRVTQRVWTEAQEKELDRTKPYKFFEDELRKLRQTTENGNGNGE